MGAVMNIGKSRAKVYNTEKPKTTFADVAGYGPVKQEISEVVDFLKNPGKFKEIGARIPKGVLLVGPPGTGKTLIARAVAGEAGVPFVSVTGSDFMEMFVGVGAARVRDLFQTARKQAPAIIFVDEIDSIGRKRGAGLGGGHDEREQTLNQMLAEMDGFEATEGIVMMAATNRPDVLDPALLRPGRFDRQIMVPLPTQDERRDILLVHFKDKKMSSDVDVDIVARGTPGMAGADLANLVNEAALFAVRRGDNEIHANDFDDARDRVLMGLRRPSIVMNDLEKEHTAYHEAGHAVAAYVFEHADPVHKVTILPTGMALGMTQQMPVEERYSHDKDYLRDSLGVFMGGRVAEEIMFGTKSTGAQNDLVRATEIARRMVREWGMSDRIGPMAWGSEGAVFLGEDLVHTRDYSDETARGHRRRGRAHPPRRGEPHPRHAHRPPRRPGRGGGGAARAGDGRRRRGVVARRRGHGPQERWTASRRCGPTAPRRSSRPAATATPSPTTSSRPARIRFGVARPRDARVCHAKWRQTDPRSGSGVLPGSRSSATAAQRSVAVNGPTNARCTTPSESEITVVGIAARSYRRWRSPRDSASISTDRDVDRLEWRELLPQSVTRVARGRREQCDQPRRIGPREVGPVELLGDGVHVTRRWVGRPPAQEPGEPADREHDHRRDHESGRHRLVTPRTTDRGSRC